MDTETTTSKKLESDAADVESCQIDLTLIDSLHSGGDVGEVVTELFQRHGNRVMAYLVSRTGNRSDSEDIAQMTWIKVAKALPGFSGNHFTTWLITIAKNTMISEFRKRAVRSTVSGEWLESIADVPELCESAEAMDRLRGCLDQLKSAKPTFFQVVSLRLAGRKHDDIAAELDIPPKTSMSRFDRAKGHLKTCIEAASE